MDPNARLKAMEEESPEPSMEQSGCATTGPGGEDQEEVIPPAGKEETPTEQEDWKRRTQVVSIPVPLGWKRVVEAGVVVYYR